MIRNEALGAFLRDRRSRVAPDRVGLPLSHRRRVRGLRREEVAQLAGLSVDYYARLEQGRQPTASTGVLRSVARALCLTDDERRHLFTLAHVADEPAETASDAGEQQVRDLVALLGPTPAMVVRPLLDVVYANPAAVFVFDDFAAMPPAERNGLRWMLLAARARERYGEAWVGAATELTGLLRLRAGQHPDDPRLAEVTAELTEHSALFRRLWRDQAVSQWRHDRKRLYHPAFGSMEFTNEFLTVQSAPHLSVIVMAPGEPGRFATAMGTAQAGPKATADPHGERRRRG
ncbi:helix-turn-helix transcriptional regulator [Actinoplanes sp. NPDC049596]|uniref:helix-turn-helix transcriptional regulator n=1 Tax=unclassified Actinoplanes TaxID=2626549 RepID=UPI00343BCD35